MYYTGVTFRAVPILCSPEEGESSLSTAVSGIHTGVELGEFSQGLTKIFGEPNGPALSRGTSVTAMS
jgi:hypothetical protein